MRLQAGVAFFKININPPPRTTASRGVIFFVDFDIINVDDADPTLSFAGARQGGDFSWARLVVFKNFHSLPLPCQPCATPTTTIGRPRRLAIAVSAGPKRGSSVTLGPGIFFYFFSP